MVTKADAVNNGEPDAADVLPTAVGSTLRALRKASQMTLEELATRAELSQPFLSQIENGKALPSLLALHRLAQALGTSAYALLGSDSLEHDLIRQGEGQRYVVADGATVRFLTSRSDTRLGVSEIVAAPNTRLEHKTSHAGQEVVHVIAGSVVVDLDSGENFDLGVGDTVSYTATVPHSWVSGPLPHHVCSGVVLTPEPSRLVAYAGSSRLTNSRTASTIGW